MKKYSRILILANLLVLLVFFNWSVYHKEQTLAEGQLLLMKLAPVDPRSLMQGDYMRLNYAETNSEVLYEATPGGYVILAVDSNRIGRVVRVQPELQPVSKDEIAVRYKKNQRNLLLGTESFFFEEGQGAIYETAAYGGFRVDSRGEILLVGLYDENFRLIRPDKSK